MLKIENKIMLKIENTFESKSNFFQKAINLLRSRVLNILYR